MGRYHSHRGGHFQWGEGEGVQAKWPPRGQPGHDIQLLLQQRSRSTDPAEDVFVANPLRSQGGRGGEWPCGGGDCSSVGEGLACRTVVQTGPPASPFAHLGGRTKGQSFTNTTQLRQPPQTPPPLRCHLCVHKRHKPAAKRVIHGPNASNLASLHQRTGMSERWE